jgi:hypothetical protein
MDDDTAVSYQAAVHGSRVLSASGHEIGKLEHVLEVPRLDLFDGIVVHTHAGLRFVDPDRVEKITRSYIKCSITDAEAAKLKAPDGPPVYHVDALDHSGGSLHDVLGRMFGRPNWKRDK